MEAIAPFGGVHSLDYDDHFLLPIEARDPLGNRTTVGERDSNGDILSNGNDYRVLAPALSTDANRNRIAIELDALGRVTRQATMGGNEGDTLADPTLRFEYDLDAWRMTQRPVAVHAFAREKHGVANQRWLESYSYSDGFGREVMTKHQAVPGDAPLRELDGSLSRDVEGALVVGHVASRWVGTGRTVFDNKGNPVKQYKPFFSSTFAFEDESDLVEAGVTPVLRYDPVGRLVRTDLPDGTHTRVEFDAWKQISFDANDTVLGTPWHSAMQSGTAAQQRAATLSAKHANTPTATHLDSLGRAFLTVEDNGTRGVRTTRLELDVEGQTRTVTDARNNDVLVQTFDLLGNVIVSASADAGDSQVLHDVAGKPIRAWNARGYSIRRKYDALERPTHVSSRLAGGSVTLVERDVFGEFHPSAENLNLRGQLHRVFDGAGAVTNEAFDFDGNLVDVSWRLAIGFTAVPDWSTLGALTTPNAINSTAGSVAD